MLNITSLLKKCHAKLQWGFPYMGQNDHYKKYTKKHAKDGVAKREPCCTVGGIANFSSVAQLCPTLCDPMDCSTPGFPVHHQLPELARTHVHEVSDAIQPSHPLPSSSPLVFNLFQHQSLFNESVLHIRWPKYWSFSLRWYFIIILIYPHSPLEETSFGV